MAQVAVPRKLFIDLLSQTKHTMFRAGQVSVNIGNTHTLISDMPVGVNNYNEWTVQLGREGEIIDGDRFLKQSIKVVKIVQQELVRFKDSDVLEDGHQNKLSVLEALKEEDPTLNLNSPVTLFFFETIVP